jgi:V8-like Glu-specific endopeptidase
MDRTDWWRASVCALCFYSAGIPAAGLARADSLESAIAVVKDASDEDLRNEIDRRMREEKDTVKRAPVTRGVTTAGDSALSGLDYGQLLAAAHITTRSIYGGDDRRDWYQLSPGSGLERLARASVALFDAAKLDTPSGGMVRIKIKSFQETKHLCPTPKPKFGGQPSGAFCSGTLVRPDLVLTAGHCVREISHNEALPADVTKVKFVFGYAVRSPGADATQVPEANVFTGKKAVGGEKPNMKDANRHDWALVRLGRPVPSSVAAPVTDWETAPVAKGAQVFVMGFPAGIPFKYAAGATVRDASNKAWFVANLDTFGGNSGSGVYNQATKKLAGILVAGEVDYKPDTARGCYLLNLCPDNGCTGETVSRLSQVRMP